MQLFRLISKFCIANRGKAVRFFKQFSSPSGPSYVSNVRCTNGNAVNRLKHVSVQCFKICMANKEMLSIDLPRCLCRFDL